MAKKSGLAQKLYVHGYDISGDVGAINNCAGPSAVLDVTSIEKSAHERIYGLEDGEISFACWFDDATDQLHDALSGLPKTDRLATWLLGTTRGDQVAVVLGKQINYDWTRGADGSLAGTVQILGNGNAREWAELLVAKVTHSSATDETGIDNGSSSAAGGVGFLQHFSGASGTIEYDIEDSSDSTDGDDGVWANLLAFTDVATPWAQTAERVEVSGTVEKWVRASTNGTFTNAVFSMAFKRV
jgi:hypothetical protein